MGILKVSFSGVFIGENAHRGVVPGLHLQENASAPAHSEMPTHLAILRLLQNPSVL